MDDFQDIVNNLRREINDYISSLLSNNKEFEKELYGYPPSYVIRKDEKTGKEEKLLISGKKPDYDSIYKLINIFNKI